MKNTVFLILFSACMLGACTSENEVKKESEEQLNKTNESGDLNVEAVYIGKNVYPLFGFWEDTSEALNFQVTLRNTGNDTIFYHSMSCPENSGFRVKDTANFEIVGNNYCFSTFPIISSIPPKSIFSTSVSLKRKGQQQLKKVVFGFEFSSDLKTRIRDQSPAFGYRDQTSGWGYMANSEPVMIWSKEIKITE